MYRLTPLRCFHLLFLIEQGQWEEAALLSQQWEDAWAEAHPAAAEKGRELTEAVIFVKSKGGWS